MKEAVSKAKKLAQNKGGFSKAYNPHLKKFQKAKKQEEAKTENEPLIQNQGEKINSILLTKEYFAKELLKNGYIDSYVDFFYLGWKKTPNLKKKYIEEEAEENNKEEDLKEKSEENESDIIEDDIRIPRHEFSIQTLNGFFAKLIKAENASRDAEMEGDNLENEETINEYYSIRNDTINDLGIPIEAIYFNQKCIDISKKFQLTESLIQSYIFMGGCFDKTSNNPIDMNISKNLKEKAREIFQKNLQGQNYPLESTIYRALINLYKELANQQEQMKNYNKAIDILNKHLEVLDSLMSISDKIKDGLSEKELEDKKTESYLKIANIYYRMKDYDHTLETLNKMPNIKNENISSLNAYQIKGLYRYAQTYEMQGNKEQAIAHLEYIDKAANNQTTDDTILAKSLLHLGRLYFKSNTLELSHKYLNKFYRKSKTIETNKELMDIARVNLGMIDGTQEKENYINKIKNDSYEQFLKGKLENYQPNQ